MNEEIKEKEIVLFVINIALPLFMLIFLGLMVWLDINDLTSTQLLVYFTGFIISMFIGLSIFNRINEEDLKYSTRLQLSLFTIIPIILSFIIANYV